MYPLLSATIFYYGVVIYMMGYLALEFRQPWGRFLCIAGAVMVVFDFLLHLFK